VEVDRSGRWLAGKGTRGDEKARKKQKKREGTQAHRDSFVRGIKTVGT